MNLRQNLMIKKEDEKYIEDLIFRKNQEVIKTMKKIPSGELFSWKCDKEEGDK